MSNTKCPACGLVNWLTPEVCERCGLPLGGGAAEARASEPARPDFPLVTFGRDAAEGSTASESQKPAVWKWYVAYCVVIALMCLTLVITGLSFILSGPPNPEMSPREAEVIGLIFVVLGAALVTLYAAAPFLPRRRWTWVLGIVLLVLGMTGTCCLPAAVALLVFWVKPENKAFFGMGTEVRKGV